MGYFCKMAYNIGEDLFAYDNGRVVAMAEYVAKYNVFKPEFADQVPGGNNEWFSYTRVGFPYTAYFYCDEQMDEPSAVELRSNGAETGRGGKRPIWICGTDIVRKWGCLPNIAVNSLLVFAPMPDRNNTAAVAVRSTNLVIVRLCFITNREEPKRY